MKKFVGLLLLLACGCNRPPFLTEDAGGGGVPGAPKAVITATPDVVGFITKLDGSSSTDPMGRSLIYSWSLTSVPAGSTLTDSSLSTAGAVSTTFDPDVGGPYGVRLTVTAPDGKTGSVTNTVEVPTVPVFYVDGKLTAETTNLSASVIRSDGTGAHPIACPTTFDAGASTTGEFSPIFVGLTNVMAVRTHEPGGLFAFSNLASVPPAPASTRPRYQANLFVADDTSDCAARKPVRADKNGETVIGADPPTFYFFPRFSPDGKRVAFVTFPLGVGSNKLVTTGVNGDDLRVIHTFSREAMAPPAWIDNATLAWVTSEAGTPLRVKVLKSADVAGAGDTASTVIHDCSGGTGTPVFSAMSQIEITGSTILLAAGADSRGGTPQGMINIYRNTLGTCSASGQITNDTVGHFSGDFSLSPDGKTIVFASSSGSALPAGKEDIPLLDIFIAPVDGSAAPKKLAGEPNLVDLGPRFIANGRQVVWTQFGSIEGDGGQVPPRTTKLRLIHADGTKQRTLIAGVDQPNEYHLILGGTNTGTSCAWPGAVGAGGMGAFGFGLLFAALLVLLARRRS